MPQPHTLRMVLHEYSLFVNGGARQYDYPNPLLSRSFEHLCGTRDSALHTRTRVITRTRAPWHCPASVARR